MSIKLYLMAILDNYMFRPLLVIFRLSSREDFRQEHAYCFLCSFYNGTEAHPAAYPTVTKVSFPREKNGGSLKLGTQIVSCRR